MLKKEVKGFEVAFISSMTGKNSSSGSNRPNSVTLSIGLKNGLSHNRCSTSSFVVQVT